MIEYGQLTELDNDYITVISDFLLYEDIERVIDNITKLAELGQINALRTYYKLDGKKNENIEKHIQKIIENNPRNFNEHLALANYYERDSKEVDEVDLLIQKYESLKPDLHTYGFRGMVYTNHQVEKEIDKIFDEVCSFKSIEHKLAAIKILDGIPYTNERLLELEFELVQTSKVHKMIERRVKNRKVKNVRKALLLAVKANPNDVASKYYLAKNIAHFGGNKKEILLGKKILEELSIRPLYIDKIKTTDEKQVDNKSNNVEKNS